MSFLTSVLPFLNSSVTVPVWVLLLLILTLLAQYVDLVYKRKKPGKHNQHNHKTDNTFTKSIITTAQKLKTITETGFTNSIVTTVSKIRKEITSRKKSSAASTTEKINVLKLLFVAAGNGRLKQSIMDELRTSDNTTQTILDELIAKKFVERRRTTLGETYYITKPGSGFCVSKGLGSNT